MALPSRQKVDLSKLTDEERKLFSLYGKLPSKKGPLSSLQTQQRKYFDSGDYNMSKQSGQYVPTGKEHPSPDTIPHVSPPTTNMAGLTGTSPTNISTSPMKESALSNQPDLVDANEYVQTEMTA